MAKVRTGDHVSKGLVRSLERRAKVGAGDYIPRGLDRGLGKWLRLELVIFTSVTSPAPLGRSVSRFHMKSGSPFFYIPGYPCLI